MKSIRSEANLFVSLPDLIRVSSFFSVYQFIFASIILTNN